MRLSVLLLGIFLLSSPFAASAQRIEKQNRVFFSNIAPGELESDVIRQLPVKIMLESETGIPYGGVYVRVFNASGIAIFKRMCEKPWLFMKLPEGDYNVVGVDRNKVTRLKPFRVKKQPEEGHIQTAVKLSWPKKVVGY